MRPAVIICRPAVCLSVAEIMRQGYKGEWTGSYHLCVRPVTAEEPLEFGVSVIGRFYWRRRRAGCSIGVRSRDHRTHMVDSRYPLPAAGGTAAPRTRTGTSHSRSRIPGNGAASPGASRGVRDRRPVARGRRLGTGARAPGREPGQAVDRGRPAPTDQRALPALNRADLVAYGRMDETVALTAMTAEIEQYLGPSRT